MWRNHSLFGHPETSEHHAVILAESHGSFTEHMHDLGEHVSHTLWGEQVKLCRVCHAVLQPHEEVAGCCADTDSCSWRNLSARCCW